MKKWRLDFRIWHWLNAFVILGLVGTVFLRKTFLSWRDNSVILSNKLLEIDMDFELTKEQAKSLAVSIRNPMWEWHIILGYALAFLLLYRVILFFTESGKYSYANFKEKTLHKKMVTLGYIGIYVAILLMSISGMAMTFQHELGLIKTTVHDIKEAHEAMFLAILIFVPLHIIGVVVADTTSEKGLVSDMINGGELE